MTVRHYDPPRVAASIELARRKADSVEMAAVPHCSLEPRAIDAGALVYGEPKALKVRRGALATPQRSFISTVEGVVLLG